MNLVHLLLQLSIVSEEHLTFDFKSFNRFLELFVGEVITKGNLKEDYLL